MSVIESVPYYEEICAFPVPVFSFGLQDIEQEITSAEHWRATRQDGDLTRSSIHDMWRVNSSVRDTVGYRLQP
jgi:hypothetical protein